MISSLSIAGGLYAERCVHPLWNELYGSGGRAAASIGPHVSRTTLHTYVPENWQRDAIALAERSSFSIQAVKSNFGVEFDYLHPLSRPHITPSPYRMDLHPPLNVEDEVVLRFGMLEGDAIVNAEFAVFDPQSAFSPVRFSANGSKARNLAFVLNRWELKSLTGIDDPSNAAKELILSENADVIIVKCGSRGVQVITKNNTSHIPSYRSSYVWKIGSGDVFSAAFTYFWANKGLSPELAANSASLAAASYCENRTLPIQTNEQACRHPIPTGSGTIYLAGPFFDLAQRWLIEEAKHLLQAQGADVFSPVHEIGPGPAEIVAPADIAGLDQASAVLAILNGLDPGTIFEIGYAVKAKKPVTVYAENIKEEDLKMISGTNCDIVDDFVTAIYKSVWSLPAR